MRYGDIKRGQHFADCDASIYKVIEVNSLDGGRVQIGLEPAWRNHTGSRWFSRDAQEQIPSSISVYEPAPASDDASPSP